MHLLSSVQDSPFYANGSWHSWSRHSKPTRQCSSRKQNSPSAPCIEQISRRQNNPSMHLLSSVQDSPFFLNGSMHYLSRHSSPVIHCSSNKQRSPSEPGIEQMLRKQNKPSSHLLSSVQNSPFYANGSWHFWSRHSKPARQCSSITQN